MNHDDKVIVSSISVILGRCSAQLVIPAFDRGKNKQESPGDVEFTGRLANVGILVARVIGSIKEKYSLLDKTLPTDFLLK